jgi:hypothetical protein
MRIGFTSIYAWRPHVEHLYFAAQLARQDGHEVRFLACDGDLPTCYTRELRSHRPDALECLKCRIGGVRSFAGRDVAGIGALQGDAGGVPGRAVEWGLSSAATIERIETRDEFASPSVTQRAAALSRAAQLTYTAARRWIERERLDAMCLFNGRMDATRGVLEAAIDAGVPFVSMERTWFSHGLQLLPAESCLGLRSVHRLMRDWRDVPLTHEQARRAGARIASRFVGRNVTEWRTYNPSAIHNPWPSAGRRRVLVLPSSRNEVWGHADWTPQWSDYAEALDAVMDHLGLSGDEVVLRCHPNWGERIGPYDGSASERHFTAWAMRRGIHVVPSRDRTSTLGLIGQCDAVIVSGGSSALEAGILGRQVIGICPSTYACAGLEDSVHGPASLGDLRLDVDRDEASRAGRAQYRKQRTLRYCHTMVYRIPQYVPYVRAITTTRYEYRPGADPHRLSKLLRTGILEPDDPEAATSSAGEDDVLALIEARRWEDLAFDPPLPESPASEKYVDVRRRPLFRPIDGLRDRMARGDF